MRAGGAEDFVDRLRARMKVTARSLVVHLLRSHPCRLPNEHTYSSLVSSSDDWRDPRPRGARGELVFVRFSRELGRPASAARTGR